MRRALLITLLLLAACGSGPHPREPATYVVERGDTLYSIAWRHGVDYRELARWNGIGRDYRINVGQRLWLGPPPSGAIPAPGSPARTARPPPVMEAAGPAPRWTWPVDGGRVAGPVKQPSGGTGLRIDGTAGQDVRSAADGRVVYTGSGLRAYGQLVIVKHGNAWLSAYGYNSSLFVREGDQVRAGQRIGSMGFGPGQRPMLYFEIRLNGQPVDPLQQLPAR